MMKKDKDLSLLSLFGEGDGGTGVTATDAASPSGENARDAAVQNSGQDGPQSRAERFDRLIKGEFKDLYDARVQATLRRRLGAAKESEARYLALAPTLTLLREQLGKDPSDADAIGKEIGDLIKARDAAASKDAERTRQRTERAQRRGRELLAQSRELSREFPAFRLAAELENERFCTLLRAGADMRSAYLVTHAAEVIPAMLRACSAEVRDSLVRSMGRHAARPAENGIIPHAAATVKRDVTRFSRSEREAIIRRVREGERIII